MVGLIQKLRLLGVVTAFISLLAVGVLSNAIVLASPSHPRLNVSQVPAVVTSTDTATFSFFSFGDPTDCQFDGVNIGVCESPYTTPRLTDGIHTFTVHVTGSTDPRGLSTYSWTNYTTPSFTGGNSVSGAANGSIAITDLKIVGAGNDNVTIKLAAPTGTLHIAQTSGVTFIGNMSGSTVELSGNQTDLNSALATITYASADTGDKTISATIKGANGERYNTVDGRVFRVVYSGGLNWDDSKIAAESSTYGGVPGYLASITSIDQANLITMRLAGGTWLGGSDAASEGDWRWMAGPEANTAFWSGDNNGAAVGGAYTNWAGGMPDNYNGNENCTETYPGAPLTWNDQDCSQIRDYYIAEYGDGITIPNVDTKNITVTVTPAHIVTNSTTLLIAHAVQTIKNAFRDDTPTDSVTTSTSDTIQGNTTPETITPKSSPMTTLTTRSKLTIPTLPLLGSGFILILLALFYWRKGHRTNAPSSK